MALNDRQTRLCEENETDFGGLRALFVNDRGIPLYESWR